MKKNITNKALPFIIVISFLCLGLGIGFYWGTNQIPKPPADLPVEADFTLFWDVWHKIENNYVGQIDYQKLIYGATKGLASGLDDPYTVFYDPKESDAFREDILGSFEGIGAELGMKEGVLTVITPLEGTPAKKAGIMPGDKIIKIEDVFGRDIGIDQAIKMIRGQKGTKVKLMILRNGWEEPKEFEIIRDTINIPSIKIDFLEDNIAHLIIYQFNENITPQFEKAAQKIIANGSKKIILDLRSNPGGLLNKAYEVGGWFLDKGSVILVERSGKEQTDEKEYKAKGNAIFVKHDLAILVNQGTASAAEILAAALKENRSDVKLIGEKTFGKGSVQEALDIRGGSLLKITVAKWLTPKKRLIEKFGLEPDIQVKISEEDIKNGKDPQLEKAIEIIKKIKN